MRRYFCDLHSSTLHLVLYWWEKKKTSVFGFGKKYNARNRRACMASKRSPLVTLQIDLGKSQNKGKCLLLSLKVSGGSSDPRSSSSTAFTKKARPQNPHQTLRLWPQLNNNQRNLLKPKRKPKYIGKFSLMQFERAG